MTDKNLKFYSFIDDSNLTLSEYMNEESEMEIKVCEFEDDVIAVLNIEGTNKIRLAVKRMEYDTYSGYCSFFTSELEGPVFQLLLGSDGYLTIDQAEDHFIILFEKYGMDVLSNTDAESSYPLFKFEGIESVVEDKEFVYGDIFIKLNPTAGWNKLTRVNAATSKLLSQDIAVITDMLHSLKPIFNSLSKDVNYLIDDILYKFGRFADGGLIFHPVPIYEYLDETSELFISYAEFSRKTAPIVGKGTTLVLGDNVIVNGKIVDFIDDIDPIVKEADKFNECLMYKYNEIIKQINNLNTFVEAGQIPYQEAAQVYEKSIIKLKGIKKDFNKVNKRISSSVYGTHPVFVMYKFGTVYTLSKDMIENTIEIMQQNIERTEESTVMVED